MRHWKEKIKKERGSKNKITSSGGGAGGENRLIHGREHWAKLAFK